MRNENMLSIEIRADYMRTRRRTSRTVGLLQFWTVENPFVKHHKGQVCEEQNKKDDLWEKLKEDAVATLEEVVVNRRHANAENHVNHTEDNRQLHFVRVEEDDFVCRQLPDRIETYHVDVALQVLAGWVEL